MSDSAYLKWHDDGHCVWATSVMHDDGSPFRYEFLLTSDGYAWGGDDELILGPRPVRFRDVESAKAWAARTEFKWQQSADPFAEPESVA